MYTTETLPLFDKIMGPTRFNQEQIARIVTGLEEATQILDLGVGIGNLATALVTQGKRVYGIDKNTASIRYATKKVNSGLFVPLRMDVHALGFKEGSFDGISCLSNLTEFNDRTTLAQEIHRVLQPGGYIAVTGVEEFLKKKYEQRLNQEITQALESGQLTISPEEGQLLFKLMEEVYSQPTEMRDSSLRTRELFRNVGLQTLGEEKFYEGTCYFVLAQKPVHHPQR